MDEKKRVPHSPNTYCLEKGYEMGPSCQYQPEQTNKVLSAQEREQLGRAARRR